jgi:hypothetical protein
MAMLLLNLFRRLSTYVLLDDLGRANVSLARLVSRFAKRPALAQQVPALVQLDLDRCQATALGGVKRTPLKKAVLFGDEVLNVRQDGSVISPLFHAVSFLCRCQAAAVHVSEDDESL